MKYILLASASAFAFAGAAVAEVSFSGEAELGYNDNAYGDNDGFYWSANIGVALTQELNNGLEAGASVNFDIADLNLGMGLDSADYVLWLKSENAALYFGTTDTAAGKHWSGVDGMEADNFTTDASDAVGRYYRNGWDGPGYYRFPGPWWLSAQQEDAPAVLRGDISYGGIDASVSYLVPLSNNTSDLHQLSVGASGSFGNFNFALAYQDEISPGSANRRDRPWDADGDFSIDRVFGVSVGTTFGGADMTLAYARNDTADVTSTAIGGSYPVGPVTLGAYFSNNTGAGASDGNTWGITADYASGPIAVSVGYEAYEASGVDADWWIDASYDVGNGLTVYAGVEGAGDAPYVAGEFDMGNGATLGLSWADDNAAHDQDDEIGARDYQEGTTAWVSFTF